MKALIMMLKNISEGTYHPILYFEYPFSGTGNKVTRFKSKGHRTIGFLNREEAVASIKPELEDRLSDYLIERDLAGDIPWDGQGVPADSQLRPVQ